MPPLPAPPHTPLLTERLLLRPYLPSDEKPFYQLIQENRPRLQPAFPARESSVKVLADATQVLMQFRHDWSAGRLYVFGIWHRHTNDYLGDISLKPNWTSPITAEIGYYLAAEAEGHGYAREALAMAVQFGFETLQAARLLIRCRANNLKSCAVAEAVGFQPLAPRPKPWLLRAFGETDIRYYSRKPEASI